MYHFAKKRWLGKRQSAVEAGWDDIISAEMCVAVEYKPGAKLVFDDVLSRPYLPCVVHGDVDKEVNRPRKVKLHMLHIMMRY